MNRARKTENGINFRCPGCGETHYVPTEGPHAWGWNGRLDRPTLTPSVKVSSGHYASAWKPGDPCWCGTQYPYNCYICHSHITDGRIAFCGDSTHKLAGQTVDLLEVES